LKNDNYIFTITSNLDAEKVAGYSPKKDAAAGFFALNFSPFTRWRGIVRKGTPPTPKSIKKHRFLSVFDWISDKMAHFLSAF
jgi:hypothetical protein